MSRDRYNPSDYRIKVKVQCYMSKRKISYAEMSKLLNMRYNLTHKHLRPGGENEPMNEKTRWAMESFLERNGIQ